MGSRTSKIDYDKQFNNNNNNFGEKGRTQKEMLMKGKNQFQNDYDQENEEEQDESQRRLRKKYQQNYNQSNYSESVYSSPLKNQQEQRNREWNNNYNNPNNSQYHYNNSIHNGNPSNLHSNKTDNRPKFLTSEINVPTLYLYPPPPAPAIHILPGTEDQRNSLAHQQPSPLQSFYPNQAIKQESQPFYPMLQTSAPSPPSQPIPYHSFPTQQNPLSQAKFYPHPLYEQPAPQMLLQAPTAPQPPLPPIQQHNPYHHQYVYQLPNIHQNIMYPMHPHFSLPPLPAPPPLPLPPPPQIFYPQIPNTALVPSYTLGKIYL
jgi:hypothetical protein